MHNEGNSLSAQKTPQMKKGVARTIEIKYLDKNNELLTAENLMMSCE